MNRTFIAAFFALSALTTGCHKNAPEGPPEPDMPVTAAPQAPVEVAVRQMNANFARVHFATDSSTLDTGSKAALEENARIMASHPRLKVEVQGHCDERGTVDYNVALGNARASAVRDFMVEVGVNPTRVATLSYGEERPVAMGSDEASWSQNRRAEFRVTVGEAGVAGSVN